MSRKSLLPVVMAEETEIIYHGRKDEFERKFTFDIQRNHYYRTVHVAELVVNYYYVYSYIGVLL